ncbi:NAD(P)H-dependent oxidoreductase [Nocardioides sp. Root151]|uniref:NAD(P)H-dependent oxidoreductase n=1 Tax=Nocardioides sp. Root151 TaxID=1736475 RepID=UPI0007026E36|nr:NAD(P)H-dependent oxidoreductase [Nocardioides sp. Root151]KQZ67214.1 NADPH-dependent FMN reductase [Nocardioides sp. Root151]
MTRVAVVVGNPRPRSRTYDAAVRLAGELGAVDPLVVDLATLGPALLDWSDSTVSGLVDEVSSADVVVVASPTYKATYTGLLKVFLDRFAPDALRGTVAVPLMLGAGPGHALAPELTLRPVLVEIGASVPTSALYLLDGAYDDPDAFTDWLAVNRPLVAALLASTEGASA